MSRRTVVLAGVALALGAALFVVEIRPFEPGPERRLAAGAPHAQSPPPPVAQRLARIDARLRLPPDRRALAGLDEIRRLLHGSVSAEATAESAAGSWRIVRGGRLVGTLSDFPRFAGLLALLDEEATQARSERGARKLGEALEIRPELQGLLNRSDDAAAFDVLARVDARWREGSASVGDLFAATDALAQLTLLLPRDTPASDRLAARALASLALARQYLPERTLRAEVALAFATGYATHARALAERLPRDEPLAAFVRADLVSLERASRPADAGHVDAFYGARLLWWRGGDAWLAWHRELPPKRARRLAVVGAALGDADAALAPVVPDLYEALLLERFDVPVAASTSGSRCAALDPKLERRARAYAGPFADAALFRDVYRSACLVAETRDPDPASPTAVRRALTALAPMDPRRVELADAAAASLDSRASARLLAGELAREAYRDPGLEERVSAAAAELYGEEQGRLAARVATLREDWVALWAMVESSAYRLDERMAALAALEGQKPLEADRLRRGYERLLQESPESEPLRRQLAGYLEKSLGNKRAARNALLPILAAHDASDPGTDSVAGAVARLYLAEGKAADAWAVLEPRLERATLQPHAVRAQAALGDLARAEALAREAHAQYPQSLPVAVELAAVLWEARKPTEAAQTVAAFAGAASDSERCRGFCRAFVRAFLGQPKTDAVAAFEALAAAQVDPELLRGTIRMFRETSEPATPLALVDEARDVPATNEILLEGYECAKRVRGEREALRWLGERLPRERLAAAAKVFYASGADELLWTLYDEAQPQGGAATWLLRSAAFARAREPDPARQAALAAYFDTHPDTPDDRLGAALLGRIDVDTLLAGARSEAELAKAAYFLGARAEAAHDARGAMRLYQLALASPRGTPGRELSDAAVTRIAGRDAGADPAPPERARRIDVAAGR